MDNGGLPQRDRLIPISILATLITAFYVGSVFFLGESFLGFEFQIRDLVIAIIAAVVLVTGLCAAVARFAPATRSGIINIQVSVLTTIVLLIVGDIAYQMVQNSRTTSVMEPGYRRELDANYLIGEFQPRLYFPTEKNFRLQKPGISVTASSYGQIYSNSMLASPTLVNSTLERRTVSIAINDLGFRETNPIQDARIFALGDSFTFGWRTNVDQTWVKRLEMDLATPIYNLGMHDSSPKQELELLKYLFATSKPQIQVRHLLWMIFEGNDLEDTYAEGAEKEKPQPSTRRTILQPLLALPYDLKQESAIEGVIKGTIHLRSAAGGNGPSPNVVDGVPLANPLFKSDRLGYKLFLEPYLDRAQQPKSYVLSHPNRPKMEKTFQEMGELARKYGFDVTVILAPTDVRLQGKYFTGFPKIEAEPYFLEFAAGLAKREKFRVIDLNADLQSAAAQKLLYFRDDDHWNEDGHASVAADLATNLAPLAMPAH